MHQKPSYTDLEAENLSLKAEVSRLENLLARREYADKTIPVGHIQIKNGIIVGINPAGLRFLEITSPSEICGTHLIDLFVDQDVSDFNLNEFVEKKIRLNSGTEITILAFLYAGQFDALQTESLYFIDISVTKMMTEANSIYKTIYDAAPDGIFITDNKGNILDCNNEFIKQLNLRPEEILGKHTTEFVLEKEFYNPTLSELQSLGFAQSIVTQISENLKETPTWRKVSGLFDINGELEKAIVFSRDITEVIETRKELLEAAEEIQRNNEDINATNEELRALNEELLASNDALKESYMQNDKVIQELRTSERKFRMIAENASEFMLTFTVQEEPNISYVSPSVKKMGFEPRIMLGQSLYKFLNSDEIDIVRSIVSSYIEKYTDVREKANPDSKKIRLNTADYNGKVHVLDGNISIFSNFGLLIAADITERLENESIKKLHEMAMKESRDKLLELNKKIAKSEESYRNIYNSATEGFFVHETDTGRIIDINQAACDMFGFTRDEILTSNWEMLNEGIAPYTLKDALSYILKAQHEGDQHFYWRSRNKSGYIFWTDVILKSVTLGGENRILAVVRDVDEEVEARRLLEESEEKFRQLSETSPSAIFIYQDDKFVHVNPSTTTMTGFSEKELLLMNFWDIVHPDMREMVKNMGQQRIQGADIPARYEMKLQTKEGLEKWIDFSASRVFYKGKLAVIGNALDISKTKHTVRELINAKERAEEADRLKSSFLANMSHEIRTPLNGILGFSQLLKEDDLEDERKLRYIDIINKSGEQLLSIINDILDISKIEVGQLSVIIEKYSVNAIVDDVFLLFEERAVAENKKFWREKALSDSESLIFTDEVRVKQILINLINNALKFTPKGHVFYGYRIKDTDLEFFVEDTGIGVPLEKQEIIFDRFRQSDEKTQRDFGGTGLGLSICRGIVEILGGKIWVESDGKTGSCFKFTIPYAKSNISTTH